MRWPIYLVIFLLLINLALATEVDTLVEAQLTTNKEVEVIVELKEDPSFIQKLLSDVEDKAEFESFEGFATNVTESELEELKNDPLVEKITLDHKVKAFLSDSRKIINTTLINAAIASNKNLTGYTQTVCILDTGVDYTHPDLGGCLGGGCKVLDGYDYVNDDSDPMDDSTGGTAGHGTHVAGIVAANGTVKGVAPNANIVAIKVLDASGTGTTSDIIRGIEWCVNNASIYNITVISASLGTESPQLYAAYCDPTYTGLSAAVASAIAQNITFAAAAGNEGNTTAISSPACLQNATAIGWTTKEDTLASGSNINSLVKLVAPGSSILSTTNTGGTTTKSGTSMSTPHVSAVIAILQQFNILENNRSLTVSEIENTLNSTGELIQSWIRINAFDAVKSLDNSTPKILDINPTNLQINITYNSTLLVNITNTFTSAVWIEINSTGQFLNHSLTQKEINQYSYKVPSNLTQNTTYSYRFYINNTNNILNLTSFNTFLTNNQPNISYYTPLDFNQTIDENQTINLTQISNDPENTNLSYYWFFDDIFQNQSQNYTYQSNYTTAGFHNLTLKISDNDFNITQTWNLTINNIDLIPNLTQVIPNQTFEQDETETINLTNYFSDADADPLNYTFISTENITITINNETNILTLNPDNDFTGTKNTTITAFDPATNNITSNLILITIDEATVSPSGGSGGGGGGGSPSTPAASTEAVEIKTSEETVRELGENQAIQFSFKSSTHTVTVTDVYTNFVILTVASNPITLVITPGQTREVDLDGDSYLDLSITLDKIESQKAHLKFKKLETPDSTPTPTPTPEANTTNEVTGAAVQELPSIPEDQPKRKYLYWLIPLIAAIIVAIIQFFKNYSSKQAKNYGF